MRFRPTIAALLALIATALGASQPAGAATISAGRDFTCAVHTAGTVSCWGEGNSGQLGNGMLSPATTPVTVAGITDATAVTAGGTHACALKRDETVRCWGFGYYGELGNGSSGSAASTTTPVAVTGLTGVLEVAAGAEHVCALVRGGTVRCWGSDWAGQLGDGATTDRSVPVAVAKVSGVASITSGSSHSCALRTDATVVCWGRFDGRGTAGLDPPEGGLAPVYQVTQATGISAGETFGCAVRVDGQVSCWGINPAGQLGFVDPQAATYLTAQRIASLSGVTSIAAGARHSCVVLADRTVKCWGDGTDGQLGNGTTPAASTPTAVTGLTDAVNVAGGDYHSCAVRAGGTVSCWGGTTTGGLGTGGAGSTTPVAVAGLTGIAVVAPITPAPTEAALRPTEALVPFGVAWFGKPVTRAVRITNTGGTTATGLTGKLSGTYAGQYSFTGLPATLAGGASVDVMVTLNPTIRGYLGSTGLTIKSANGGEVNLTLEGEGRTPIAKLSTTSLAFGSVASGTSVTKSITVTNSGDGKLTFAGYPQIAGAAAGDYTWSGSLTPLSPRQSHVFTVTFTPSALGSRSGTIRFTPKSTKVALTGSGA